MSPALRARQINKVPAACTAISSASVEGSLTAVGAYANGGQSYGIETFFSLNVSGGTVVAQGGKSANNTAAMACVSTTAQSH
jgi:hypothetical protein